MKHPQSKQEKAEHPKFLQPSLDKDIINLMQVMPSKRKFLTQKSDPNEFLNPAFKRNRMLSLTPTNIKARLIDESNALQKNTQRNHHRVRLEKYKQIAKDVAARFADNPKKTIGQLVNLSHKISYHENALKFYGDNRAKSPSKNWWDDLTSEMQEKYLHQHSRSRKKLSKHKKKTSPIITPSMLKDEGIGTDQLDRAAMEAPDLTKEIREALDNERKKPKVKHSTNKTLTLVPSKKSDEPEKKLDLNDPTVQEQMKGVIANRLNHMGDEEFYDEVSDRIPQSTHDRMDDAFHRSLEFVRKQKAEGNDPSDYDNIPDDSPLKRDLKHILKTVLPIVLTVALGSAFVYFGGGVAVASLLQHAEEQGFTLPHFWHNFVETINDPDYRHESNFNNFFLDAIRGMTTKEWVSDEDLTKGAQSWR